MDGDVVMAVVLMALVASIVGVGVRPVRDHRLQLWERRFNVRVPDRLRADARQRLRRDRGLRTTAVALGILVGSAPAFTNLVAPERSADMANPAVSRAWLLLAAVGALLAQLVVSHRRPPGPARALMVRREVGDYVPMGWVTATMALGALAVALASAAGWRPGSGSADEGWWWFYALGAVVAVGALGLGLRALRDRPLATADQAERDLDEALRADGAHHLVGTALALAGGSVGNAVLLLAGDRPSAWGFVVFVLSLGSLGAGFSLAWWSPWDVAARRMATHPT